MQDLVSWPRTEPGPPALGPQSLNHWTTREDPGKYFLNKTQKAQAIKIDKLIYTLFIEWYHKESEKLNKNLEHGICHTYNEEKISI